MDVRNSSIRLADQDKRRNTRLHSRKTIRQYCPHGTLLQACHCNLNKRNDAVVLSSYILNNYMQGKVVEKLSATFLRKPAGTNSRQ